MTSNLPKSYKLTRHQLTIDGEPFPYYMDARGPRVEPVGDNFPLHVLWVPIIIDAPLPEYVEELPGVPAQPECDNHKPVQHRDGRPPWCNECGAFGGGGGWMTRRCETVDEHGRPRKP